MIKLTKLPTAFLILIFSTLAYSFFLWFVLILPPTTAAKLAVQIPEYLNDQALKSLPSDLQVQVSNGYLQLNRPSPTCFFDGLIYDASARPDTSLIEQEIYPHTSCSPKIILGSTFLMVKEKDSFTTKVYNLPKSVNFSLTSVQLQRYIYIFTQKSLPILSTLYYFVPLILSFFLVFLPLFSSLFYATILSLSQKILHLHPELNFGHNYAFSLSILCFLNLFFLLLLLIRIIIPIPFLNTILILGTYMALPTAQIQSPQDNDLSPLPRRKSGPKKSSA